MNKPTCPLRKKCLWCGKMYGRKLRHNTIRGFNALEPIEQFKSSKTCSKRCRELYQGKQHRENREKRLILEAKRDQWIDKFIYAGRA